MHEFKEGMSGSLLTAVSCETLCSSGPESARVLAVSGGWTSIRMSGFTAVDIIGASVGGWRVRHLSTNNRGTRVEI